jgi:phage terminase large subunit GpA-like protein
MRLVGANRVGALKSSTIRYVKFEEPDEYVTDLGDQGHPIDLAIKRTSNFGRKAKVYGDGTPTLEGRSAINKNFKRGDQRRWHLLCPDCHHPQPLQWSQIKWTDGDPSSARYLCRECGSLNAEHVWKTRNYAPRPAGCSEADAALHCLAHWQATATGEPGVASWHLNALAAPLGWRPWTTLVVEWLGAQGDEQKLKSFVNNQLGECWADQVRSEVGAEHLQQRAEAYDLMTCPQPGLLCTAGVDTQDNRLAVVIRSWGRGEESWGVWHGEIYGNPSSPETWSKLRDLLEAPIQHASGQVMRVDAVAIDAGGHHGEDVYAFCRDAQLRGKHWFAIRGAKSYDAPKLSRPKKIEFTWRGNPVPGGAELRFIGTQALKNLIDGRLQLPPPKAGQPSGGSYHFPLGFQADYFKQLRSERREWRRDVQGHKALWWVKGSERNEAWDCEVYAYAAYLYAMAGQHAETVFRNREKLFGAVRQLELLSDEAVTVPVKEVPMDEPPAKEAAPATLPAPEPPQTERMDITYAELMRQPRSDAGLPPICSPAPPLPAWLRRRQGFVHNW